MDGILGVEAEATLQRPVILFTTKWKQPYYLTFGYVKSRVKITMAQESHCCIQGPQWED